MIDLAKISVVDAAVVNLVTKRRLQVYEESKMIRVRNYLGTPDEMIAKKTYPCTWVQSGFIIDTPEEWGKNTEENSVVESDPEKVEVIKSRIQAVDYYYRIGCMALYSEHVAYLIGELVKGFPSRFDLSVALSASVAPDEAEVEYVPMQREGKVVSVDDIDGDLKVYRREFLMKAQLMTEDRMVESLLRPFAGVKLEWMKI